MPLVRYVYIIFLIYWGYIGHLTTLNLPDRPNVANNNCNQKVYCSWFEIPSQNTSSNSCLETLIRRVPTINTQLLLLLGSSLLIIVEIWVVSIKIANVTIVKKHFGNIRPTKREDLNNLISNRCQFKTTGFLKYGGKNKCYLVGLWSRVIYVQHKEHSLLKDYVQKESFYSNFLYNRKLSITFKYLVT